MIHDHDTGANKRLLSGDVSRRLSIHHSATSRTHAKPSPPEPSGRARAESVAGYRVTGLLGEGGMGIVWEAEEERTNRKVALKVMRSEHVVNDLHRRMFRREAEALARLDHPSIAAIYDSGHTTDGHDYFSMEIVSGLTLDLWIASRKNTLDSTELVHRLRLFRAICDAVHFAHSCGVVHRDLKPSNLIIHDDEEVSAREHSSTSDVPKVRILDFGLASITDSDIEATTIPEIGVIRGTLQYMSPEQARCDGETIGEQSDVYSLGVVLYELLSGAHPYEVSQSALAEALRLICEEPPTPLKKIWSWSTKLDADLVTIVGKALEKDVNRRYRNVAELKGDIDRHLASQPIVARPPRAVDRFRRFSGSFFEHAVFAVVMIGVKGTNSVVSALQTCRRAVPPRWLSQIATARIGVSMRLLRQKLLRPKRLRSGKER